MESDLSNFFSTLVDKIGEKRLSQLAGMLAAPAVTRYALGQYSNPLMELASAPVGFFAGGDIYNLLKTREQSQLQNFQEVPKMNVPSQVDSMTTNRVLNYIDNGSIL